MSGNLLPSATYASPDNSLWATKVAPTVISPISIKSPNGIKTGTIAQNDNGNMNMYSDPTGDLFLGAGNINVLSPSGLNNTKIQTINDGTTKIIGDSSMRMVLNSTGTNNTFTVQKGTGSIGQVFDSVYNTPFTYISLQAPTTGNVVYNNTLTDLTAGKYQLQLSVESPVPGTAALSMFAVDLPGTQVINFSGVEVVPTSVGANLLNMNSGYFTYDGTGGLKIEINTNGNAWTGTWEFQLVKLG